MVAHSWLAKASSMPMWVPAALCDTPAACGSVPREQVIAELAPLLSHADDSNRPAASQQVRGGAPADMTAVGTRRTIPRRLC
jgi:hypothetical protein